MQNFTPADLFELDNYSHTALFAECHNGWEALSHIVSYLAASDLGKIEVEIPAGVYMENPHLISIGQGTRLEPGCYIIGPCIIGSHCTVRHSAYIRGNVIAGNSCVIGHATEIKHAILLDNVHAAHFAYIGDSILGNGVSLGAGVKCANLKLDRSVVCLSHGSKRYETGLYKLGAIIGDTSQIGCNAVLNPGTLFGKGVICYPCVNIGGVIPPYQKIRHSSKMVAVHAYQNPCKPKE